MFTKETLMAFVEEIPSVLDIAVRYWYEFTMHVLNIFSNML